MTSKKKVRDEDFYFTILNAIKSGKSLSNITKEFSISKQLLNYYIRKLHSRGLLTRKSYGYYESKIKAKDTLTLKPDMSRGHAFIWTLKLPQEIDQWDKRIEILEKHNIPFKLVGALKTTPRILIGNNKVWLGNKTITIFENKSFYADKSTISRKYALISLIELVERIESKLGINLHPIQFKPAREHYGLIMNDLAIQCNRKNEKLHISDKDGEWLLVDNSLSLGELETIGKDAMLNNLKVQNWWNDQKRTNFEVTPSFLMESLNKLTAIQIETNNQLLEYKIQNKKHLRLIQEYRNENRAWRKKESERIRENVFTKTQTTLNKWTI